MIHKNQRLTSGQVCAMAHVTYRQLYHWTRLGLVLATPIAPGSGYKRTYSQSEAKRVVLMAQMVEAGILPSDAAHLSICGEYDENGVFRAPMHKHVYVEVFP
jgi:hypothetical protein